MTPPATQSTSPEANPVLTFCAGLAQAYEAALRRQEQEDRERQAAEQRERKRAEAHQLEEIEARRLAEKNKEFPPELLNWDPKRDKTPPPAQPEQTKRPKWRIYYP
jgi:hypothetical protein